MGSWPGGGHPKQLCRSSYGAAGVGDGDGAFVGGVEELGAGVGVVVGSGVGTAFGGGVGMVVGSGVIAAVGRGVGTAVGGGGSTVVGSGAGPGIGSGVGLVSGGGCGMVVGSEVGAVVGSGAGTVVGGRDAGTLRLPRGATDATSVRLMALFCRMRVFQRTWSRWRCSGCGEINGEGAADAGTVSPESGASVAPPERRASVTAPGPSWVALRGSALGSYASSSAKWLWSLVREQAATGSPGGDPGTDDRRVVG